MNGWKWIMRIRLIPLFLFVTVTDFLWGRSSLLFTDKEIALIQQNTLKSGSGEIKEMPPGFDQIFLSAIIYIDQSHWALCLNNEMVNSENPGILKNLHIHRVFPEKVDFSWVFPHSTVPLYFTLYPNEIFLLKSRKVEKIKPLSIIN